MRFGKIKNTIPKLKVVSMAPKQASPNPDQMRLNPIGTVDSPMTKFKGLKRTLSRDRNLMSKYKD